MERRERAERIIEAWLAGVSVEAFRAELDALIAERIALGEYRFRSKDEQPIALAGAVRFFREFSRKIVELSDGRCVYFAPDARAHDRNGGNLARCWAEYAFHAVNNGGAKVPGKNYNERWFNPYKIMGFDLLEKTLKAEQCIIRLNASSRFDAVVFVGDGLTGMRCRVITRLDEFGNLDANLTEVTFEASSRTEKKTPRLVSLAEAVQAVVHHQIATGSNPSDKRMIPNVSNTVNRRRILHLCWGLEPTNGAANIARMIMREQETQGHTAVLKSKFSRAELKSCDELWCHCGWYWRIWAAVRTAKKFGKKVYWMPECCYDPIRRAFHGWKKTLVGLLERRALRRADVLVATCKAEARWIRDYEPRVQKIIVSDIKRFFRLPTNIRHSTATPHSSLHVLFLGRQHPLKGVKYLERAVREVNEEQLKSRVEVEDRMSTFSSVDTQEEGGDYHSSTSNSDLISLRIVSSHSGEELEQDWAWCDVLCLPTLSENFGLVVAEALERGKRVITTDGAPVWEPDEKNSSDWPLVYLRGYRDGTDARRVQLLKLALRKLMGY